MQLDVLTKGDLQEFREQLLRDLKALLPPGTSEPQAQWLKSKEVRQLLRISPNTLQTLRVAGKLHPTKLGGTLYYSRAEIQTLLQKGGGG